MSGIERTECVEHGAARMIGRRCHAWVGPYVLCLRDGVTMEYVPASQLAGAVGALDEAITAARLFNRNGMTWLEYDRLLVRLESVVNHARGQ